MQKNRLGNFPTRFIIEPFFDVSHSILNLIGTKKEPLTDSDFKIPFNQCRFLGEQH